MNKKSTLNGNCKCGKPGRSLGWLGFGAGVAAGILVVLWREKRQRQQYTLPHAAALRAALGQEITPEDAELALALAEINYTQLCADAPPRENKAIQQHLFGSILPGLALYRALQDVLGSQEAALKAVEQAYVQALPEKLGAAVRLLQYMPRPFALFRKAVRWQMATSFPQDAWRIEWLDDSEQSVAFNLYTCLYLDTLRAYGAEELTPVFCGLDDLAYDQPLSYLRWERTTTLARGGPYCDFRWSRRVKVIGHRSQVS